MNSVITGLRGFSFNGVHNKDLGVVMHSKSIQPPPKKKVKDTVPFMNGSYDFSTIGSNGEITYSERSITIIIGLPAETKEELQVLYSSVLSWLSDAGKQQLIFDVIPDYYYMAEVEAASSFEETMSFGQLTVTFVADPFKSAIDYVGTDIWDVFNFEEDYMQDVIYEISGSSNLTIYNPGRSVRPTIYCNSAMTITKDSKTYTLTSGYSNPYGFTLTPLSNTMSITGTGTLAFIFRKESI